MQFEHEAPEAEQPSEQRRNTEPQVDLGGRPPKLEPSDEILKQISGLARIQCTQREAAAVLGVHRDTFSKFLHTHEKAQAAWDDGLETGKASLRRHQYKAAENGNATMMVWLGKQWLDQTDKTYNEFAGKDGEPIKTETKHVGLDEFASRIAGLASRAREESGNSEPDAGPA